METVIWCALQHNHVYLGHIRLTVDIVYRQIYPLVSNYTGEIKIICFTVISTTFSQVYKRVN